MGVISPIYVMDLTKYFGTEYVVLISRRGLYKLLKMILNGFVKAVAVYPNLGSGVIPQVQVSYILFVKPGLSMVKTPKVIAKSIKPNTGALFGDNSVKLVWMDPVFNQS